MFVVPITIEKKRTVNGCQCTLLIIQLLVETLKILKTFFSILLVNLKSHKMYCGNKYKFYTQCIKNKTSSIAA